MTEDVADVIIIGAGPIGSYLAGLISKEGLCVHVFEARKKQDVKKDLGFIHFDVCKYEELGIPRPPKDQPLYYGTFYDMWQIPLDDKNKFAVPYETDIIDMNGFVSWIAENSEKQGKQNIKFFYDAKYLTPIIKNAQVVGANIENFGERFAKVIVDCSGMHAFVRNSLPPECGCSQLYPRPHRTFSLHMEHWNCLNDFPKGSNTYVCFKGFANQLAESETLVGLSTLDGLNQTKQMHEEFRTYHLKDVQYEIIKSYSGEVPYDFPPTSLVGNGFVSVGDAAFQNRPDNGEGMATGMMAAQIASKIIKEAINQNDVSQNGLWNYNVEYFHNLGAKFGLIRGAGEALVEFTPEEFNWNYAAGFVTKEDMISTWTRYEVKKNVGSLIKSGIKGLSNWNVFKRILKGLMLGMKFKKLYKKYPTLPENFPDWEQKFKKLFEKI